MEHRKKGRKLKRTASHKKALLANLSLALIKHKRIKTTVAKAKELRTYIEPLINKAKIGVKSQDKNPEIYVHNVRQVRKYLKNREGVNALFKDVAPAVLERNGGYTRVLKTGFRVGDGADEAVIELVDFSTATDKAKTDKKAVKETQDKKESPESKKKTAVKKTTVKTEDKVKAEKKVKKTPKAEETKEKTSKKTVKKEKSQDQEVKPKKTVKKSPARKKKEE